jgi:hypothetical protein
MVKATAPALAKMQAQHLLLALARYPLFSPQ